MSQYQNKHDPHSDTLLETITNIMVQTEIKTNPRIKTRFCENIHGETSPVLD